MRIYKKHMFWLGFNLLFSTVIHAEEQNMKSTVTTTVKTTSSNISTMQKTPANSNVDTMQKTSNSEVKVKTLDIQQIEKYKTYIITNQEIEALNILERKAGFTRREKLENIGLKRLELEKFLLLSKQNRFSIEKARRAYIKRQLLISFGGDKVVKKKPRPPLVLDSVILSKKHSSPSIVINGKWINSPTAEFDFTVDPNKSDQIILKINNREYIVPVGSSFYPDSKKVVSKSVMEIKQSKPSSKR